MKQKIKEAITQGYKNLGVPESVVDGLTALGVTVVKDESEIDNFVNGELVKGVMTSWQSESDKIRTKAVLGKKAEYEAKIAELEAKLTGNNPPEPKPEPKPQDNEVPAWAQALIEQNKTLAEKLTAFETANAQKSAVAALDELKSTWDYAKGYPDESEYAYNMAMGIYNGIGKTWTAEQLTAKYKETFNERVSKKGVDTTQPFKSDGGAGEGNADFSSFDRAAKELGWTEPEK